MTATPHEPPALTPETAPARGSLLGRVSHHLRTQNWTAVVIELIVVVFGVFLGFQLSFPFVDSFLKWQALIFRRWFSSLLFI